MDNLQPPEQHLSLPEGRRSKRIFFIGAVFVALALAILTAFFAFGAPFDFKKGTTIEVESGQSLSAIARELEDARIIRSPFLFRAAVIVFGSEKGIMTGFYRFEERENVFRVAHRLSRGLYGIDTVRLTIPEGTNRFQIAELASTKLPGFVKSDFLALTADKEGYLFPDTYFFLPHATASEVVRFMSENFATKTASLSAKIAAFGKPLSDIIKMASILEGEARQMETRRMVAGILWKRIALKMPLQVDASFVYINGKTSAELTLDDLKIDSPYNSYIYRGLPPTPISNPGLDAMLAAVTPIKSDYLYFLTDADGIMHYATTLQQHALNKKKYLR